LTFKYPKQVGFKCTRCLTCCRDTENRKRTILLMRVEAECIARKTGKTLTEFVEKTDGVEPYVYCMKKTIGGTCVFLDGHSCSIYRVRPIICKFYPFELHESEGEYTFSFTSECPSIRKGPVLQRKYFENLFKAIKKLTRENVEQNPDEA